VATARRSVRATSWRGAIPVCQRRRWQESSGGWAGASRDGSDSLRLACSLVRAASDARGRPRPRAPQY
jgi:hypothetical protein